MIARRFWVVGKSALRAHLTVLSECGLWNSCCEGNDAYECANNEGACKRMAETENNKRTAYTSDLSDFFHTAF